MASFLRTKSFMFEDLSSNYSSGGERSLDVFQWWNATAESKRWEHGVFYALSASYAIVSIIALVQLIRIQLRVPEYGWTTQKIFHLMNFVVNGIRAIQFGLYKSMFNLRPKVLEMILLDLPGLLFFSTYTLLVLFWAEIYHQARSLPINKLRPTYLIVNAFVYITQICIWVYMRFSKSYMAIEVAKLFFAVISFCTALGFMIYGGRLFIMLQRFPIESRGRQKKLHEVGVVTGVCCTCFLVRCFMVALSAFDKDADVDVDDHPILNLAYYMIVEVFPSAMVLFILRKVPPRRVSDQYHPIN